MEMHLSIRSHYTLECERKFKSELEKAKTKRMIDAKYKNAKEYWKLLKDAVNTHTRTPKGLSTNTFAEYFKSINNPDSVFFQPDEDILYFQQRFLDSEIQVMFSVLDVEVIRKEIIKSIRQLKNGKSGGPDKLLNEFFTHGQYVLLPSLHSLFDKL